MSVIVLIITLNVLFHAYFINGQEPELRFNTSMYRVINDYYAHIGENVVLECSVPSGAIVSMTKGSGDDDIFLVRGSRETTYLRSQMEKYTYQRNNEEGLHQITIHKLEVSDSSFYRCSYCILRYWDFSCNGPEGAFLYVKDASDDSDFADFCELVNNTNGIFFIESSLTLRCPKLPLNLKASRENDTFIVDFREVESEDGNSKVVFLRIDALKPTFNGTMLSCFDPQDIEKKDYCRFVPTIFVFHQITIKLSGGDRQISNGTNVTFTCQSYPFLPLTIQWDVLDINVRFDNVSLYEIDQGSQITFENVEFLTLFSSSLKVFCNVTIGSESSFKSASIYPRMEDVASTQITPPVSSEIISTPMNSSTQMTVLETDKSLSPIFIVIPTIVAIGILGIIALYVVFNKLRKPISSPETVIPNGYVNNVYETRNSDKTELGLEYHGSEVVENTAYASYDGI